MTLTQKFNSTLITISIGLVCVSGIAFLQVPRLRVLSQNAFDPSFYKEQEKITQLNVELYQKLPTFGFDNLIADWIMLRFIQYFGDGEARKATDYSLSSDYLEAIISHDPEFVSAYLIISPASSLYAGTPERSVALLNKGLEKISPENSQAYLVWLYKAIDELLFLGDAQAARKSYEMAAKWAALSDDPASDRIEQSARKTAQFLANNPESKTAQIGAWVLVLSTAPDEKTRQIAIRNVQQLGGTVEIKPSGEVIVKAPPEE